MPFPPHVTVERLLWPSCGRASRHFVLVYTGWGAFSRDARENRRGRALDVRWTRGVWWMRGGVPLARRERMVGERMTGERLAGKTRFESPRAPRLPTSPARVRTSSSGSGKAARSLRCTRGQGGQRRARPWVPLHVRASAAFTRPWGKGLSPASSPLAQKTPTSASGQGESPAKDGFCAPCQANPWRASMRPSRRVCPPIPVISLAGNARFPIRDSELGTRAPPSPRDGPRPA